MMQGIREIINCSKMTKKVKEKKICLLHNPVLNRQYEDTSS